MFAVHFYKVCCINIFGAFCSLLSAKLSSIKEELEYLQKAWYVKKKRKKKRKEKKKKPYFIIVLLEQDVWCFNSRILNAHANSPISLKLDSWHFSINLSGAISPELVLARDQAQMARFAKHLPIQRIAAVLIWFRRELDGTDLQKISKTT